MRVNLNRSIATDPFVEKHDPILGGLTAKFDVPYKYHDVVIHHNIDLKENFEEFLEHRLRHMLRVSLLYGIFRAS